MSTSIQKDLSAILAEHNPSLSFRPNKEHKETAGTRRTSRQGSDQSSQNRSSGSYGDHRNQQYQGGNQQGNRFERR